jgi:hypothetical protein
MIAFLEDMRLARRPSCPAPDKRLLLLPILAKTLESAPTAMDSIAALDVETLFFISLAAAVRTAEALAAGPSLRWVDSPGCCCPPVSKKGKAGAAKAFEVEAALAAVCSKSGSTLGGRSRSSFAKTLVVRRGDCAAEHPAFATAAAEAAAAAEEAAATTSSSLSESSWAIVMEMT